jgi:mannose-1-phosphate guanylyltransferase
MNKTPNVLIMAGGVGSRFWPASREHLPKQFLDITGTGKTLIQSTFDRFAAFVPVDKIFVITHDYYRDQTARALPGILPQNIICEPSRNNTAASIAYASLKLSLLDPEGVCVVAPADHLISNEKEFQRVIELAIDHADNQGSFITLGITPTRPDTGYGYIEFEKNDSTSIRKVKSFREKPDAGTAKQYVDAGSYVWNSGLFIWRFDQIIAAYKKYAPQIHHVLSGGIEYYNTDRETEFLRNEYPLTEKISVDYAILEKADNVFTIPCDLGWSDLGTWNSLYDISPKDQNKNAALTKPVYLEDTRDCLISSKHSKLIVLKGLEDFIIVDTDDCLMIYPKSEEQNIRQLKEKLSREGLDGFL